MLVVVVSLGGVDAESLRALPLLHLAISQRSLTTIIVGARYFRMHFECVSAEHNVTCVIFHVTMQVSMLCFCSLEVLLVSSLGLEEEVQ